LGDLGHADLPVLAGDDASDPVPDIGGVAGSFS